MFLAFPVRSSPLKGHLTLSPSESFHNSKLKSDESLIEVSSYAKNPLWSLKSEALSREHPMHISLCLELKEKKLQLGISKHFWWHESTPATPFNLNKRPSVGHFRSAPASTYDLSKCLVGSTVGVPVGGDVDGASVGSTVGVPVGGDVVGASVGGRALGNTKSASVT